jgi:hypothetical protein
MSRPIPYSNVIIDPLNDLQVKHWSNDLRVQTYISEQQSNWSGRV